MPIILDGTAGITTPEIVSTGGPLVVNASAPDNSVVVNASGDVGIGTSTPARRLDVRGGTGIQVNEDGAGTKVITLRSDFAGVGPAVNVTTNDPLLLMTNNAERARIDSSGNLLVGTTTTSGIGKVDRVSGFGIFTTYNVSTTPFGAIQFQSSGTEVGRITINSSSTSYVTSSDYRLKHDIQPMTGALAKVAQLKPVTYKWNVDNSADEGFIAHELQEVCPSAVSGEKDAVDAEGNPQYQGIDTSFLVATLTAAIQELKAINDAQAQTIESLTARVVALEQA